MKKIFYLSFMLISLVSCGLFIPGSGDEPWTETFLSTIDADGENLQHLVKDVFGRPKFSHDGEKIIISNSQGFWTVNSDGTNFTCILDSLNASYDYFSVSPIEETVIFFKNGDIYKLNYVNCDLLNLTSAFNEDIWEPSFSSDGTKIVFSTSLALSRTILNKLYTMNDDGSNFELIFQDSTDFGRIYNPIYSDDMNNFFFINTYSGFYSCDADGENINQIFSENVIQEPLTSSNNYVIFNSYPSGLYSFDYDLGLLSNLGEGQYADISPDGTKVTFYDHDLYIIDIDGSNRTKIANTSNYYQSFSFDGEQIVFFGEINHSSKRDKNPLE